MSLMGFRTEQYILTRGGQSLMHKLMCTFVTTMKKKKIPDRNLDTSCPADIPCNNNNVIQRAQLFNADLSQSRPQSPRA